MVQLVFFSVLSLYSHCFFLLQFFFFTPPPGFHLWPNGYKAQWSAAVHHYLTYTIPRSFKKGAWKLQLAAPGLLSAQFQVFFPIAVNFDQDEPAGKKKTGHESFFYALRYVSSSFFFRTLVIHGCFWQVEELTCQSSLDSFFLSLPFPPFAFGKLRNPSREGQ